MFGIGTQELLLVLVVVLLLFGGKRIPEVARSLGKGMADFRKAMREVQREVDLEMLKTPEPDRRVPARPAVPPAQPAQPAQPGQPAGPAEEVPSGPPAGSGVTFPPAGEKASGDGAGIEP
jgi:sec-independent protein translocase protein TatA